MPPSEKAKVSNLEQESTALSKNETVTDGEWLKLDGIVLRKSDKLAISSGGRLSDLHISYAQGLLKSQFPTLNGLRCTLYQSRKPPEDLQETHKLQIIHSRGKSLGCSIYSQVTKGWCISL